MQRFDRSLAHGPWRALPVPAFLADRRAALRFQLAWAGALAAALALLAWAAQGPTDDLFLSARNLRMLWQQATPTLLLALGTAAVFARGGLDLSAPAIGVLAAVVGVRHGPEAGFAAALACGLANGALVAALRIPGWLVTGLTSLVISALATSAFDGERLLQLPDGGLPWALTAGGLAVPIGGAVALLWLQLLPRGGADAPPSLRRVAADAAPYLFSAALAAVSGFHSAARLGVVAPHTPDLTFAEPLLVVVLGGTWLGAGRANVAGALLAAAGLAGLQNALALANADFVLNRLVTAALVLLAPAGSVAAHALAARRRAAPPDAPAPATAAVPMGAFDRALFHGPGAIVPIPVHLADRPWARRIELGWNAALIVALAVLVAVSQLAGDTVLLDPRVLASLGRNLVPAALLALGACAVVARGGFDFSAPALATLAGVLAARHGSPWSAFLVVLGLGILNGAVVGLARVPGWLWTGLAAGVLGLASAVLTNGVRRLAVPAAMEWIQPAALVVLAVAALGVFAWVQLSPGSPVGPAGPRRSRLADGLPYALSAALAGVAGLHFLQATGGAAGGGAASLDLVAAVIVGGCWLGAGRANVVGVLLALAGFAGVQYALYATGAEPERVTGLGLAIRAGMVLLALAAAHVVHRAVARAHVRSGRRAAVPVEIAGAF
jgi:ribose/xylose/arabinose/galactoside ABC-type transport system permease subunit